MLRPVLCVGQHRGHSAVYRHRPKRRATATHTERDHLSRRRPPQMRLARGIGGQRLRRSSLGRDYPYVCLVLTN